MKETSKSTTEACHAVKYHCPIVIVLNTKVLAGDSRKATKQNYVTGIVTE